MMQALGDRLGGVLGKTYDNQVCSIARALELVGERWSLLIVREALFAGSRRYTEFQRGLGIATNILSTRLDGFVASGIMRRRAVSDGTGAGDHAEYVLTDKGRALAPVLVTLTEWGDRWANPDDPPVHYEHATCGGALTQQTTCARCGHLHDPAEIRAVPGPRQPTAAHPGTRQGNDPRGGRRPEHTASEEAAR